MSALRRVVFQWRRVDRACLSLKQARNVCGQGVAAFVKLTETELRFLLHAQLHQSETGRSDRPGAGGCEIDNPPLDVRAAVVDADDDRLPGADVGDFDFRPEGQSFVSCGQRGSVRVFAIGGFFAAINGRDPRL